MSEEKTIEEIKDNENKESSDKKLEEAKELLKKEKIAKAAECAKEIQALLDKYDCVINTRAEVAPR